MNEYYNLLGIEYGASEEEVKNAFLLKKKQFQPYLLSKNQQEQKYGSEQITLLTKAYKAIKDDKGNGILLQTKPKDQTVVIEREPIVSAVHKPIQSVVQTEVFNETPNVTTMVNTPEVNYADSTAESNKSVLFGLPMKDVLTYAGAFVVVISLGVYAFNNFGTVTNFMKSSTNSIGIDKQGSNLSKAQKAQNDILELNKQLGNALGVGNLKYYDSTTGKMTDKKTALKNRENRIRNNKNPFYVKKERNDMELDILVSDLKLYVEQNGDLRKCVDLEKRAISLYNKTYDDYAEYRKNNQDESDKALILANLLKLQKERALGILQSIQSGIRGQNYMLGLMHAAEASQEYNKINDEYEKNS